MDIPDLAQTPAPRRRRSAVSDLVAVGTTTASSVRLWMRSAAAESFVLAIERCDGEGEPVGGVFEHQGGDPTDWTTSVAYPDDFPGAGPLASLTRYRFRISRAVGDGEAGALVGEGTFETSPATMEETPEQFSFAFMSCHQPFDEHGELIPEAERMLELLGPTLERYDAKFVLLIGDQMYSDHPPSKSLFDPDHWREVARHGEASIFDCSEDEILHHYHDRYRAAWSQEQFVAFPTRQPTYWMYDDHEVVDNWGSAAEHSEPHWRKLFRAARRAFVHYQAAHARPVTAPMPESFHQVIEYGTTATFLADLRSQRRVVEEGENVILGQEQLDDFARFLEAHSERHVLFVALTVPVLPIWEAMTSAGIELFGDGSDLADRWAWEPSQPERDRLLTLIEEHQRRHPHQKVILLAGDVHLGCALRLTWSEREGGSVVELVSSGVTNVLDLASTTALKAASGIFGETGVDGADLEADFLEPQRDEEENPFVGLNFGIIEVTRRGEESSVRFRLMTYGEGEGSEGEEEGSEEGGSGTVVAFDSGEL